MNMQRKRYLAMKERRLARLSEEKQLMERSQREAEAEARRSEILRV